MLGLSIRDFLRLAGLGIADRLAPAWLRAQRTHASENKRKLIVVTSGGGFHYQETFAPEGLRNIPRLAALKGEGRFFSNCVNHGVLSHYNSTSSIMTGKWQRVDDFGFQPVKSPKMFEQYR